MKLLGLLLAVFVASASASSIEWRLGRVYSGGPNGDMLFVETSLTIRWNGDLPLELIAWTSMVDVGIEVRDDKGKLLEEVITTGPAPAFKKKVILKRGESRTFDVSTGIFVFARTGTYTATGHLNGESPQGKVVVFDLGKLDLTVEKPAKKEPIQSTTDNSVGLTPHFVSDR